MQRGEGGVVFVHINESATPGCECLATLLKGKLPVHEYRVLCCYSGILSFLEIYSVFTGV
jgi:hypothetical protein